MFVVDTAIRWSRLLASRTAHALVHPVETATEVADLAGNAATAAAAVVSAVKEADRDPAGRSMTAQPEDGPQAPDPIEVVEAAATFPPEPPVITEPKPSSADDWRDELDDPEDVDELAAPGADLPAEDDTPLLDPSVAKAVRHESTTMRRAAERDPEASRG